jgi:hypothetical protein
MGRQKDIILVKQVLMILKELNTLQIVLIKDRQSKNKIKWTSSDN